MSTYKYSVDSSSTDPTAADDLEADTPVKEKEDAELPYSEERVPIQDRHGNPMKIYNQHDYLNSFECRIGIDNRGIVQYYDGEKIQSVTLDQNGSILGLFDAVLQGKSPEEHVVNISEQFGKWWNVNPELVERIDEQDLLAEEGRWYDGWLFSGHACDQWTARAGNPFPIEEAWEESFEIQWYHRGTTAWYHPGTRCTFTAADDTDVIATTYPPLEQNTNKLFKHLLKTIPDVHLPERTVNERFRSRIGNLRPHELPAKYRECDSE